MMARSWATTYMERKLVSALPQVRLCLLTPGSDVGRSTVKVSPCEGKKVQVDGESGLSGTAGEDAACNELTDQGVTYTRRQLDAVNSYITTVSIYP